MSIEQFREEVRAWLAEHLTDEIRSAPEGSEESKRWTRLLADKGWIAPNWPKEYGGAGLGFQEHIALVQELRAAAAPVPPDNGGQGLNMVGPTILEFGTEDQKRRHLPGIARGEVQWCQGYSEPGAGSDLASLAMRAVLEGDHYVVNGQKIWTSGADGSDWIYALVRTDPEVPKHDGISLLLFDMSQPGITTRPIRLISGASPFCETFFDNAIASKDDLIGEINKGWTVGKRLLQHERSGIAGMGAAGAGAPRRGPQTWYLAELAKEYTGVAADGRIADGASRDALLHHRMHDQAFQLTLSRVRQENATGGTLAETTSIFKAVGADLNKRETELQVQLMGCQGTGWEGEGFTPRELGATRNWLGSRAISIAGGTNEVQLNIIAKRVLGLPD